MKKDAQMLACCGLVCSECGAYIATKNDDDELRRKTAREWSAMFDAEIRPEDINCEGCLADETTQVVFAHCRECEYRLCARGKGLNNCGECRDYPCDSLLSFFEMVPGARERLDAVRNSL